jgi:MFS family permease
MLYLLRQRNFGLLWFGGLISFVGDWITGVALPVYIYSLTGSYLATGAVWMSNMLPSVVLGSVAGVYVDRWDRRVTMVATNLLTVPLMLALLVVRSPEQVWIVYVVGLLKSTIGNFMGPAENALLPKLVADEHLLLANALNTLNNNLARLIGPAIGGAVLAYLGFTYAMLMDATSFLVAGVMIALIRAPRSVTRAAPGEGEGAAPNAWREWLEGLHMVRANRLISLLFLFMGVAMVSEGFFEVLITPYVKDVLRGGAQELGWMMTAQAVGGLLGGAFVGRVSKKVKPANLIGPGLFLLGLIDLAIFNIPVLQVDLLLFVLAGPPVIGGQTGIQTLLQTSVEDRYRGRLIGAYGTTLSLTILAGQAIASLAGGATGPSPLMSVGAILMATMGLVALATLGRLTGERAAAPEPGLEVTEG